MASPVHSPWVVMTLEGELDISRTEGLDGMVASACNGDRINAIIDLTGVTFMDSSALSWLLRTQEHIKKSSGRLRVVAPDGGNLMRLVTLTGLEGHLKVFPTMTEAEQEISAEVSDAVDQLLATFADPDKGQIGDSAHGRRWFQRRPDR